MYLAELKDYRRNTFLPHNDEYNGILGIIEGKITKQVTENLKVNKIITCLDLHYYNLGDSDAKYIAEALKVNRVLNTLNLQGNNINDVGAKYIAEALKVNHVLNTLDLYDNNISDEGAKYIAEALKDNYTLTSLVLGDNMSSETIFSIESMIRRNQDILKDTSAFVLKHFSNKDNYPSNIDSNYFKNTNKEDIDLFYKNLKAFQKVSKTLLYEAYISSNDCDKNDPSKNKSKFDGILLKINNYINSNYLPLKGVCKSLTFTDESLPEEGLSKTHNLDSSLLSSVLCNEFSKIDCYLWPDKQHLTDNIETIGEYIEGQEL